MVEGGGCASDQTKEPENPRDNKSKATTSAETSTETDNEVYDTILVALITRVNVNMHSIFSNVQVYFNNQQCCNYTDLNAH